MLGENDLSDYHLFIIIEHSFTPLCLYVLLPPPPPKAIQSYLLLYTNLVFETRRIFMYQFVVNIIVIDRYY